MVKLIQQYWSSKEQSSVNFTLTFYSHFLEIFYMPILVKFAGLKQGP